MSRARTLHAYTRNCQLLVDYLTSTHWRSYMFVSQLVLVKSLAVCGACLRFVRLAVPKGDRL
jgi:hypothetical protein